MRTIEYPNIEKEKLAQINSLMKKSSNEKTIRADWDLIDQSIQYGIPFIKEEIKILEPDIVITGNIGKYLFKIFNNISILKLQLERMRCFYPQTYCR